MHQAIRRMEDEQISPNYEILIKEIKYMNLWRRQIKTDLSEDSGIDPLERVFVYKKTHNNWINIQCDVNRTLIEGNFWKNMVRWKSEFLPIEEQTYKLIFIRGREKIPCLLTGTICSKSVSRSINKVFVGYADSPQFFSVNEFKRNLEDILNSLGLQPSFWEESLERGHFDCKFCKEIQESIFVIFELSDINPNVLFEFGFSIGIGKDYFVLHKRESKQLPSDIEGLAFIEYSSFKKLASVLPGKIQSRYSKILEVCS